MVNVLGFAQKTFRWGVTAVQCPNPKPPQCSTLGDGATGVGNEARLVAPRCDFTETMHGVSSGCAAVLEDPAATTLMNYECLFTRGGALKEFKIFKSAAGRMGWRGGQVRRTLS